MNKLSHRLNFFLHIFNSTVLDEGVNKSQIMLVSLLHLKKYFGFLLILIEVSKLIDKKSFVNIHCVKIKRIIFCSKFKFFLFNGLFIFGLLSHRFEFFVDFLLLFLEIFLLRALIGGFRWRLDTFSRCNFLCNIFINIGHCVF